MKASTRDGRTLAYEQRGLGAPTVVFEAGMGATGTWWAAVVPLVAAHTTTVTYDRSGLGQSAPDAAPRTLDRLAADLGDLLTAVGDGPFVLVAHSWGGPVVRRATALAPERVAGLVLVDPTDEASDLYFGRAAAVQRRVLAATLPALARTGVLSLALRRAGRALPPDDARRLREEEGTLAHARALSAELAPFADDLRRLADEPLPPPDVPVTVISGTRSPPLGRRQRNQLVDAHRARAQALPRGRHRLAPRSGHYVLLSEPRLVADETLRIVEIVRDTTLA